MKSDYYSQYPTLRSDGIAVEHYPRYVNRKLRMHSVPFVLMSYIVQGRGTHVMDDIRYEERGQSLAITHYNQKHDIITDEQGMDVYNILLDLEDFGLPPLPAVYDRVLPAILPLHPGFQNLLNRRIRIVFEQPNSIPALLELMAMESYRPNGDSGVALRNLLSVLLMKCCRAAMKSGIAPIQGIHESHATWLSRLILHIDTHYMDDLSLTSLASLVRIHPNHLSRAFRQYVGKPLIQYINERRVQMAMLLLRSTNRKVIDIAMECGFQNVSAFNRLFKQKLNCSPGQYRQGVVADDH